MGLLDDAIKEMQDMEVEIESCSETASKLKKDLDAEKITSGNLRTENSQLKKEKNECEGIASVLEDALQQLQQEKESEDCCLDEKCNNYAGTVNKTMSGRTCQAWNVNTPHSASYRPPKDGGLNTNFCRNPSSWSFVWCYTTDPDKRWEKCDVPKCGGKALKLHKQVVELQKENANYKGQIDGLTKSKHELEKKLTKCEADLEEVTKVCYDALTDCKKKVVELGECCKARPLPLPKPVPGCEKEKSEIKHLKASISGLHTEIQTLKDKTVQCVVDLQVCRGGWEKVNGRYVKFFNDKKSDME